MLKFDKILHGDQKHMYDSLDESPPGQSKRQYLQGWRFGAINCAISATVVFFINIVVTIVCSRYGGQGALYVGNCEKTRKINSGLHIIINILSTVLLSASNYCMQCLSAPTRQDIDAAHARGKWLDIGVLSLRNLRSIGRKRVILWALLGLSSLPLHLLYNSVVFMSIASFEYYAAAVGQSFVDSPDCAGCTDVYSNTSYFVNSTGYYYNQTEYINKNSITSGTIVTGMVHADIINKKVGDLRQKARSGQLKRLENIDCINTYAQMIQSSKASVLLVVQDKDVPSRNPIEMQKNSSVFWDSFAFDATPRPFSQMDGTIHKTPYEWICSSLNSAICTKQIGQIRASADTWHVRTDCRNPGPGVKCEDINMKGSIQYCLAEEADPVCKIRWNMDIGITVVIINFLKAGLMFYTAFGIKEEPLMAMGDAIMSFLEQPDTTTRDMCLCNKKNIVVLDGKFNTGPRYWGERKYSWRHAVSRKRRLFSFALMVATIALVGHFLRMSIESLPSEDQDLNSLANLGFGAIDPRTMWGLELRGVVPNALLANVAQVVISVVYFTYNSLFTSMLLGYEWSTYAHKRKGLRVTHPAHGAQRSTYFLSLPYRFGLPLMAVSSLLHWLVSQCIFFVSIDVNMLWEKNVKTTHTVGFSPIAMIAGLVVGVVLISIAFGMGYIPHKPGTNLAGSCSAAMSAACHPLPSHETKGGDLVFKKLQWGVVSEPSANAGIGHCAFSDGPVQMPQRGEMYAGS